MKKRLTPFLILAYLLIIWEVTLIVKLSNGAWPTIWVFITPILIIILCTLNIFTTRIFQNYRRVIVIQIIATIIAIGLIIVLDHLTNDTL